MIYVFRRAGSQSARDLSECLPYGRRSQNPERLMGRFNSARDFLVSWGDYLPGVEPPRSLNNQPLTSKLSDAIKLAEAGVKTIEVSRIRPINQPEHGPAPVDPAEELWVATQQQAEAMAELGVQLPVNARGQVSRAGLDQFIRHLGMLAQALSVGAPVAPVLPLMEWLGRKNNHVGGDDLLRPQGAPDFYVKKETITTEYRVHSFLGRSLRAGKKTAAPDEGQAVHPWVRSLEGGWKIIYDGVSVKQRHRDLAHAAVRALGLDFGAVDIAERPDGSLFVLEVNRAPGLDGGTIECYAKAITRFTTGEWTRTNQPAREAA